MLVFIFQRELAGSCKWSKEPPEDAPSSSFCPLAPSTPSAGSSKACSLISWGWPQASLIPMAKAGRLAGGHSLLYPALGHCEWQHFNTQVPEPCHSPKHHFGAQWVPEESEGPGGCCPQQGMRGCIVARCQSIWGFCSTTS